MDRPTLQVNVLGLLGLVGCVAVNLWLFRVGAFWGLVGLNVTKHVAIAWLCRILGVDRRGPVDSPGPGMTHCPSDPAPAISRAN